ncbi:MAG: oxidoreductase domain protein [Fibrobacteres bacterium]|nr:oxidoreductase domain protein [Fibrobacterota bacterium]
MPVAIVGCGYWGPNLIRNFFASPHFRVAAVVDRDPARLEPVRANFPSLRTSTDFAAALAPEIGLVVLATPPETHHPLGLAALNAGKHLLVEKPMALSSAHCGELNALAARKGLKILVDHTFLFNPAVEYIKSAIASGDLGELRYLDSTRINLGLFQEKINVVWDLAPHDFSIVDYLLDEKPASVSAIGAGHLNKDVENLAYVTFKYPSGMICHFNFNWLSPVKVRKTLLGGSKKMILFDDTEPTEKLRIYDHGVERKPDQLKYSLMVDYRTGDIVIPKLPQVEALSQLVEHAHNAIAGAPTFIGGDSGERIVRLVEAAQESMAAGGLPVALA